MTMNSPSQLPSTIAEDVRLALAEDVGSGDLTAALIPEGEQCVATVISREVAVISGCAWFEEVFRQLDPTITIEWQVKDGDSVVADQLLCTLRGPARTILTGERSALNFLQTLSGTATKTRQYVDAIAGTGCTILDTRKTLPGLRLAQKYAVTCGGGKNHRIGLYDAILIKENHIMAAGSITQAVTRARALFPNISIEVEVENLTELQEAITSQADTVMLDNMSPELMREAVELTAGRCKLEASGNVNMTTIRNIAETGVDFISIGALTKDLQSIDLSMRFQR
jgi:nicotinate-nucleotide pyrophosphorylase (carboxylating)